MDFCDICNNRLDRSGRCFTCDTNEIRKSYPTTKRQSSSKSGKKCYKCQALIYFDNNVKSESGKFIPMDKRTNERFTICNEKLIRN